MNDGVKYFLFFAMIACFFQAKTQSRASYWVTEQKCPYHFMYPVFDAKDENKLYYVKESSLRKRPLVQAIIKHPPIFTITIKLRPFVLSALHN